MRTRKISLWLCATLSCWVPAALSASEARNTAVVQAVKKVLPAVVNIHSEKLASDKDALFAPGQGRKVNGMGTGIVIDERGYILTNQHVIADVESLTCTFADKSTYTARVISYDRKHDLAVIKVDPSKPLAVMPLGTSSDLSLGETVIAIGNAFGYEHTVTLGILSSLSRDVEVNETQSYKNLLQTDAAINPGNSGGPLLNLDGEVIGINVAIRAGAQKIGFAIPMDDARRYLARLLNVERLNDTYHGIIARDVKGPGSFKLVIDEVEPNSPALSAGVRQGDVITQVGAVKVCDAADLERSLLGRSAGEMVEVAVVREAQPVSMKLQMIKAPANLVRNQGPGLNAPVIRGQPDELKTVRKSTESLEDQAWRTLGLKLVRLPASNFDPAKTRYRGGLQVTDVRADGPASKNGIQRGDVLVGLHVWETVTLENLQFILNHPDVMTAESLKFYVLRGPETLYGHLPLASRKAVAGSDGIDKRQARRE